MELYHRDKFASYGIHDTFVQDNQSFSSQGTLRGLHYQLPPFEQSKLITVLEGEIYDVVVDVRAHSKTVGQWLGLKLDSQKRELFYIPSGFAHGFYVLSPTALIQYKCGNVYNPDYERSLLWNDPKLGIEWPLLEGVETIVSQKDQNGRCFENLDYIVSDT